MDDSSEYDYSDSTHSRCGRQIKLVLDKLRLEQHSCSTCSKVFASVNSLNAHLQTHVKDEPLACGYDGESVKHITLHDTFTDIKEENLTYEHKYPVQNRTTLTSMNSSITNEDCKIGVSIIQLNEPENIKQELDADVIKDDICLEIKEEKFEYDSKTCLLYTSDAADE